EHEVQRAVLGDGVVHKLLDLLLAGHVDGHGVHAADMSAELADGGRQPTGVVICEQHDRAGLQQRSAHRKPNARGAAGDDANLAVEVAAHHANSLALSTRICWLPTVTTHPV